jgi:hypothetical protein
MTAPCACSTWRRASLRRRGRCRSTYSALRASSSLDALKRPSLSRRRSAIRLLKSRLDALRSLTPLTGREPGRDRVGGGFVGVREPVLQRLQAGSDLHSPTFVLRDPIIECPHVAPAVPARGEAPTGLFFKFSQRPDLAGPRRHPLAIQTRRDGPWTGFGVEVALAKVPDPLYGGGDSWHRSGRPSCELFPWRFTDTHFTQPLGCS